MVAGAELLLPELTRAGGLGSPIFGWFDAPGSDWESQVAQASDWPPQIVSTVVSNKASEVMLALPIDPAPHRQDAAPHLHSATSHRQSATSHRPTDGWPLFTATVDLVDEGGHAERLTFGTPSEKSLETFKDELWALDEYAGIRYRDPNDPEHALLDISLQPHLAPLRRALSAKLHDSSGSTVAQLRSWALHKTVYRLSDATKAVQAMVTSGAVTREPVSGRLSADTIIRPA